MQRLVKVPYIHENSGNIEGYFYLRLSDAHWAENGFEQHLEGSVWNQRGWTFQERLLSKRILHFPKDVFCLECRTRDYTEDNQPAVASVSRTPWLQNDGPRLQSEMAGVVAKNDRLYRRWYELLGRYSIREFTYSKDKLPAIAGLAHEMASFLEDMYMDGLWRDDLSRGLMWTIVDEDYDHVKSNSDRAPSWSWAHFDGWLHWSGSEDANLDSKNYICGFTFLEYRNDLEIDGQIEGASSQLKVRGKLLDVSAAFERPRSTGHTSTTHDILLENAKIGKGFLDLSRTSHVEPGLRAFLVH
jgi:hypothetical protein